MRIFADENISAVGDRFAHFGHVTTLPGRLITREILSAADVLLVRSVTPVDAKLVEGTPVKFVGSATSGTDHVDVDALSSLGIQFAHAPGSNAASVCDYVVAAILYLAVREGRNLTDLTCAVVGCGEVGGRLAPRLEAFGMTVLRSDPPRADSLVQRQAPSPYIDTDKAIEDADIVTLHVPLHSIAPYSTFGLFQSRRFDLLKEDAWIINTSRGPVIDEEAFIDWLGRHPHGRAVVDVWMDEPMVECKLLRRVSLGTAHIAGYAAEGKLRATDMMLQAFGSWAGIDTESSARGPTAPIPLAPPGRQASNEDWLHQLVRKAYDIETDHRHLESVCDLPRADRPKFFDSIRHGYQTRHELSFFSVPSASVPTGLEAAVTDGLGMAMGS